MDTMKHRILSIHGMTCTGCEGEVEGKLKEMRGIKRIKPGSRLT